MYFTSWWDCGGMNSKIGGINPTCHHPKHRPTTPQELFVSYLFLYQKQKDITATISKKNPTSDRCDLGGVTSGEKVKVKQINFLQCNGLLFWDWFFLSSEIPPPWLITKLYPIFPYSNQVGTGWGRASDKLFNVTSWTIKAHGWN